MRSNKKKILIINSHPIQYFAPLYKYLNTDKDVEVIVVYFSDISLRNNIDKGFNQKIVWDIDLLEGYKSFFIGNYKNKNVLNFFSINTFEIFKFIKKNQFDIIWFHGYNYLSFIVALLSAKINKIPCYLRGETHLFLEKKFINKIFHKLITKILFKLFNGFFSIGTANKEYYLNNGINEEKIFMLPYSIDNKRFTRASKLSDTEKKIYKKSFGINNNSPIVLYASKLTKRKNILDLIQSAIILKDQKVDFNLLIIGSGELENEIRKLIIKHKLENIIMMGFVNQSKMPIIFGISDIFVLTSDNEPWGLVVNEAMCARLPIILAKNIGCSYDLLRNDQNGFLINSKQPDILSKKLKYLIQNKSKRIKMGEKSYEIIMNWSYEEVLLGLKKVLKIIY